MRNILVLRGGALGDFIVTLPALALLRQRWPDARIEIVGNATAAQLGLNRGLVNAVHSQHDARWSALFSDAALPPPLQEWLRTFDLVLSYWPDPTGELRRRFPLHSAQVFLSADAMPALAPAAAHYCEPLRALGLQPSTYLFRLDPASSGTPLPRTGAIAIHPGSGSPRKNWPLENWRQLVGLVGDRYSLIIGEAEAAQEEVMRGWPNAVQQVFVDRPLEELVCCFSECNLFLGHDSGISHLAAACGARCLLLFGPTEPRIWAPPAPNVLVVQRGPDPGSIPLDDVVRAAAAALADQK
jgi:heptosyltransferase III